MLLYPSLPRLEEFKALRELAAASTNGHMLMHARGTRQYPKQRKRSEAFARNTLIQPLKTYLHEADVQNQDNYVRSLEKSRDADEWKQSAPMALNARLYCVSGGGKLAFPADPSRALVVYAGMALQPWRNVHFAGTWIAFRWEGRSYSVVHLHHYDANRPFDNRWPDNGR
jgi:hypothetical protein